MSNTPSSATVALDPDVPTSRQYKHMVARRDSALMEVRSFLESYDGVADDRRAAVLVMIDRAMEPAELPREAQVGVPLPGAIDTDAVAWAFSTLGEANLLGSTPENARMSDRLFAMLRGSTAVPNTDAFPVTEADHRLKFEKWAAKHWPNGNPPESAWTGWFAHARDGAQEPHWRRSYDMAVQRMALAAKYMTTSTAAAFNAEWVARRAQLRALPPPAEIESRTTSLLRRAMRQLDRWVEKYGENDCAWLPPAGDVELMEDVSDLLGPSSPAECQAQRDRMAH